MNRTYPLIRAAMLICSTYPAEEGVTLADCIREYMQQRLCISEIPEEEWKLVRENRTAQRFYGRGRSASWQRGELNRLKRLMRELWTDLLLTQLPPTASAEEFMDRLLQQYQAEKQIDSGFCRKYFNPYVLAETYFQEQKEIISAGNLLRPIASDLRAALRCYAKLFREAGCPQLDTLYTEITRTESALPAEEACPQSGEEVAPRTKKSTPETVPQTGKTAPEEAVEPLKVTVDAALIAELEERFSEMQRELEHLRAQNTYLERSNHDKEIKIKYAEKDAARRVLLGMIDEHYGTPLSELYLLKGASDTPPAIRRAISNLFLALENLNIKPCQERLVGQIVKLDARNAGVFHPAAGSELKQGDNAYVRYPGYRIGAEIVCRPVIQRLEDKVDE